MGLGARCLPFVISGFLKYGTEEALLTMDARLETGDVRPLPLRG